MLSLENEISQIRKFLPSQAPLKDFIHHNTLHAFQKNKFAKALELASEIYQTYRTLNLNTYYQFLEDGKISMKKVERLIDSRNDLNEAQKKEILYWILAKKLEPRNPPGRSKIRDQWKIRTGVDLDEVVTPLLFRIVSQYLDQGISLWPMPESEVKTLWECIRDLVSSDGFGLAPLTDTVCKDLMTLSADQAVEVALGKLVDFSLRSKYLWETCFAHPGWSGMVSVLDAEPHLLSRPRKIQFLDFVALKLVLEVGVLSKLCDLEPIRSCLVSKHSENKKDIAEYAREILQQGLEETYYQSVLELIKNNQKEKKTRASVQAFFCIDDRECSIRRHLENIDASIETFGTPGFFGIDAMIHRDGELLPIKSCPAPVKPKHLIVQKNERLRQKRRQKDSIIQQIQGSTGKSVLSGFLNMPNLGAKATLRLVSDMLNPFSHSNTFEYGHVVHEGELHLLANEDQKQNSKYQLGYSLNEMATRVAYVLQSVGVKEFAPLIVIVAHGSSSANNPYFAAYDCGACSGKPGAANARAFAAMANMPEVRKVLLEEYEIRVPDDTWFVPAMHDTCAEKIIFFDLDKIPSQACEKINQFTANFERALDANAIERCRAFKLIHKNIKPKQARKALALRSTSIFEPRPELNHAGNASCIVGRRELTRNISLNRRAFLQSYDPSVDSQGVLLEEVLSAVIPVCAGINLEYYFSRIDPDKYGAGTKLPHNVIGLIGVANGVGGDLLTGLPIQMTEFHDPIRLMLVVEQKPEVVKKVLKENPALGEWVFNEWVILFVADTTGNSPQFYRLENAEVIVA